MSDFAGGNADRDAFFAALGQVFKEFPDVGKGYGIIDIAHIAGMLGADVESRAEIRIGTGGSVVISTATGTLGAPGECITTTFNLITQDWECIYFMAP